MTLVAPPDGRIDANIEMAFEAPPDRGAFLIAGYPELVDNPLVPGIGEAELVCIYPETVSRQPTNRDHLQYRLQLDSHAHSLLVTNSKSLYSEGDIYFLPGLTQTTDNPGGVGFKFHRELARRHPDSRIISIASTGIGRFDDRISDLSLTNMENMAEQRFRIMQAVSGDQLKRLVTLSMGTVIGNRLLQLDLATGNKLNVEGVVKLDPAQVDPDRVTADMLMKFPLLILPDVVREVFDGRNMRDPRKMAATVITMAHLGLRIPDLAPIGAQIWSLRNGTLTELSADETDNYPVATTFGTSDPVAQPKMWEELKSRPGSRLLVKGIPRRGHGMAADPVGTAASASRLLLDLAKVA